MQYVSKYKLKKIQIVQKNTIIKTRKDTKHIRNSQPESKHIDNYLTHKFIVMY